MEEVPLNQPGIDSDDAEEGQLDLFSAPRARGDPAVEQTPGGAPDRSPPPGRSDETRIGVQPACLTAEQAARYLGISRAKLYELLGERALRSLTIGRSRRIPLAELDRFIADRLG